MKSAVRRAAVVLGAGALMVSATALTSSQADATGTSFKYNCTSVLKGKPIAVGTWTAGVAPLIPSSVAKGGVIKTPIVAAVITAPTQATSLLQAAGITTMQGTASVGYSVTGAVVNPGARSAAVAAPLAVVPRAGDALGVALLGGPITDTAASKAGTVTYSVANVTASFKTNKGTTLPISCTPASGQSLTVATVTVK